MYECLHAHVGGCLCACDSSGSVAAGGDESVSFVEEKAEEEEQQQQQSKRDPRYYIADELLQTEKNYVSILTTIVKVGDVLGIACMQFEL